MGRGGRGSIPKLPALSVCLGVVVIWGGGIGDVNGKSITIYSHTPLVASCSHGG